MLLYLLLGLGFGVLLLMSRNYGKRFIYLHNLCFGNLLMCLYVHVGKFRLCSSKIIENVKSRT